MKRYHEEQGTEVVDSIIENPDSDVVISSLSIIETVSAFRRKYNTNEVNEVEMNDQLSVFFREALDESLVVPLAESIIEFSFDLVLEDDLRTLDSMQLAAALSIHADIGELTFVCADSELIAISEDRGVDTVNPTAME